jgi:hypothetical protein
MKKLGEALASPRFFSGHTGGYTSGDPRMRPYPLLAAALTAVLLAIGGPSPAFALNTSSQETSADLAEQNRMLSQRATKAYLMALQGINPAAARDILADSTARLERNLATLRTGKLDEATRSKLSRRRQGLGRSPGPA